MNMCLGWWDETDFIYTQKYIIQLTEPARPSDILFHINTQLENNTSPQKPLLYTNYTFLVLSWSFEIYLFLEESFN